MNREDVRRALNIPDSVQAWEACSSKISKSYGLQLEASLWIYKILMQYNYRILFFSGDTDGCIPTYSSRQWISNLELPITGPWRRWTTDGQLSGFLINY